MENQSHRIVEISEKDLKEIQGGIGSLGWLAIGLICGACFGSIEDFNSGASAARASY